MKQEPAFSRQLHRLWASARRRVVLLGLLRSSAVVLPSAVLALWVAGAPRMSGQVLLLGLALSLVALVSALVWEQIIKPWRDLGSPQAMAERIETHLRCRNMVLAAEESARHDSPGAGADPITRELWHRVLTGAGDALQQVRIAELFPLQQGRMVLMGLLVGCLLLLVTSVHDSRVLLRGAWRLVHPEDVVRVIPRGGIYLEEGPDIVVAGETVLLHARDFGAGDDAAICQIQLGAGAWQNLPAREIPSDVGVPGLPGPFRSWEAELANLQEDFNWRFQRQERLSDVGHVRVLHHPLLTNLGGRIIPPAYTHVSPRTLEILPVLNEIPVGGVLQLKGTTSGPVNSAGIALATGDTLAMTIEGRTVRGDLPVTGEVEFQVLLLDENGLRNQDPLTYRIHPLADQKPGVRLERPNDDGILPLGGEIRLLVEAADDFGLRNLQLKLRPQGQDARDDEKTGWQGGVIWPADIQATREMPSSLGSWQVRMTGIEGDAGGLQTRLELVVDLSSLELTAGEGIELVAVARDNREPGAGQTAWSDVLHLVLPSAADVLVEQAKSSEARRSELEEAQRRTHRLGQDLDRLTRELMKNPTPDWTRLQEMEDAIARKRDLQKQLAEMSRRLQEELDRLAANQMTSERQLSQADQITSLLEQQENANLDGLLEKMESRPEALDPQDVARALQEVARNQKDLARRMDAALAMLNKMDREQEMEGMTALLEKIMREQQKLAEQSRELAEQQQDHANAVEKKKDHQGEQGNDPTQPEDNAQAQQKAAEDLAARQQELAKDLEEFQKQMEQALKDSQQREQKGEPSDSEQQMQKTMQDILEQLKKQQSQEKMNKAGEQLQELDPEQAAKMQEQALRDLGSLYHVMLQSQEAMQMAMQQNQIKSLRGLAADMLDLSFRQEDIAQRVPSQLRNVRIRDLTRGQYRMQRVAMRVREKLSNLSAEAPLRIFAILKKLDSLIEVMGYGVNALEEGQGSAAQRQSREALVQANRIVIGLLTEAQMSSSGGGSGSQSKPSLAEKLMQMIKEQAGLNGMTEELRKLLANRGLSQEARARMQRLGEGQGDLAGRMEELAEKERIRPDGERVLGDLAQLGKDMEAITGDIGSGMVSEETLRRQERILSRMLDARNSVRRRDYSLRRESRTAARIYGDTQAGSKPSDQDPRRFRLRYQALDSAPPDYQSLVRRYFSALDSLQRLDGGLPGPGSTP